MTYLATAVVVLGALCLFHLVLTLGIIRRLRAQDAQLAQIAQHYDPSAGSPTVDIGAQVGGFETFAVDGSAVTSAAHGTRLAAFFTPGCRSCTTQLDEFIPFAARFPGETVAVVVADAGDDAQQYTQKLATVAKTVVEPSGGPMATAYAVTSYPALALTDPNGLVLINGNTVGDVARYSEAVALR